MPLKFGLFSMTTGPCSYPDGAARVARAAETAGFESLWGGEHVVLPDPQAPPSPLGPGDRIVDPIVALTFLAAHTSRIRLGTGIIILPQRNPLVLAKELATLDVMSNGRLIFGVGVGYLEPEFRALGAPFEERGARHRRVPRGDPGHLDGGRARLSRPLRRLRARPGASPTRPEADAAHRDRRPHQGGVPARRPAGPRMVRLCAGHRRGDALPRGPARGGGGRRATARAAAARDQRVPARTNRPRRRPGVRRARRAPPRPDSAAQRRRRRARAIRRRNRVGPGRPGLTPVCASPSRTWARTHGEPDQAMAGRVIRSSAGRAEPALFANAEFIALTRIWYWPSSTAMVWVTLLMAALHAP